MRSCVLLQHDHSTRALRSARVHCWRYSEPYNNVRFMHMRTDMGQHRTCRKCRSPVQHIDAIIRFIVRRSDGKPNNQLTNQPAKQPTSVSFQPPPTPPCIPPSQPTNQERKQPTSLPNHPLAFPPLPFPNAPPTTDHQPFN